MARVLVVEDEVDINNLIRTELEAGGYSVSQAFDGQQALQVVEEQMPQLIILDWMLPGLDGLSVCRRIRQSYLVPIIMLTARDEDVDLRRDAVCESCEGGGREQRQRSCGCGLGE